MDWFVVALISILTVSISNLLQRALMKEEDSDPATNAIVFQILCTILVFAYSFWQGFVMPPINNLALNFILLAVLYGAGNLLLFKGLKTVEASDTTILVTTRAIWTILVALLFLNETLNPLRILGIFLIFGAIILVFGTKEKIKLNKGAIFILLSAVCFGVELANDSYILRQSEVVSFTAIGFLLPAIAMIIFQPKALFRAKQLLQPKRGIKMLLLSIIYSIQAITAYLAYKLGGNISQLAPIFQSSLILTVILAIIFLNEKDRLKIKLASAVLVTIGILLIR